MKLQKDRTKIATVPEPNGPCLVIGWHAATEPTFPIGGSMSGKEKMTQEQSGRASANAESLAGEQMNDAVGSTLGSDIQAKIGQHLRAMYDDVVRQGVPDRFLDLLARLDKSATGETPDGEGGRS